MAVDATTQTALEEEILRWRVLAYADFVGDTLRATSAPRDVVIGASGDAELDGIYDSYPADLIAISNVKHNEDGSDTVTMSMSGLIVNNVTFLNLIGNKANWQGRIARLWFYNVDANEQLVGSYIPYYTGYMNDIQISGDPASQTVAVSIENYLSSISGGSNKTYMNQKDFDSGDNSAAATIAAANGLDGATGSNSGYGGGGGGGGGGWRNWGERMMQR